MNWTRQAPTVTGFYWWRPRLGDRAVVITVWIGDGRNYGEEYSGEWYGPLQEPGGDAIESRDGLAHSDDVS